MLVSFLFWNLNKRLLQDRLAGIVATHAVDIVMLAECEAAPDDIKAALKRSTTQDYYFSAVMTRQLAARGERKVQGRPYRFFYNPMWGHFGDRTIGPPGTYHLSSSKPLNYFWNMHDQVLLRPELMESLRDLRILDSDGVEPLVTQSGTLKTNGSDHLPLFFQLEL